VFFQRIGHAVDHLGVGQHAQLDRVDIEIIEAGGDLGVQECDRRHMHGGDAAGVLRGQRGDRRKAMHAVGGKGFQVGLDAGTTAGIGSGDGEGGSGCIRAHGPIVGPRHARRFVIIRR